MKITANRPAVQEPPPESYTLVVSPEELCMLRNFATVEVVRAHASWSATGASRFLDLTRPTNVSLPWAPEKCFV